jgi:hypothetical protein
MKNVPKSYTGSRFKNVAFKTDITQGPWGTGFSSRDNKKTTGGASVPSSNTIKIDGLSKSQQDEIRNLIKSMKGS